MWKLLQERLLGLLVVVAFVALMIPIFFPGERRTRVVDVPRPPSIPVLAKKEVPAFSEPSSAVNRVPVAFVVELGHFEKMSEAKALVASLSKQHYKVFSYQAKGLIYVCVGPVLTRLEAQKLLNKLNQTQPALKGSITQFDVDAAE